METITTQQALMLARQTGRGTPLPADDIDLTLAYAMQERLYAARGEPLGGWKIGLTGQGIRTALGASDPAAGRLTTSDILHIEQPVPIGADEHYVEGELIFLMGQDLPASAAPFSHSQVAAAVAGVYIGFELVSARFDTTDLPLGWLVADNCMANRVLLGDKVADGWDGSLADTPMMLNGPGDHVAIGSTNAVMGDPLRAVTWLANWLGAQGIGLAAGHYVSSGTCTGVTQVRPGDRLSLHMPGLGGAKIEICSN